MLQIIWDTRGYFFWLLVVSALLVSSALLLASTAVQLLALMSLEQETVVNWQFAVAVQRDFPVRVAGRLATWRVPLGCMAQELAAGRPRIAARASLESGGWLCGV